MGAGLGEETGAALAQALHWTAAHGLAAARGWAPLALEHGRALGVPCLAASYG